MANVLNFKCPSCGAKLTFNGEAGEMVCEFCDAHFTMEQAKAAQEAEALDAASSDMTWTTSQQAMITDEDGSISGYLCPSCGAEMVAGDNTAATECPYCGNQAIIPQSFEGIYRPDLMIPFAVDKEKAKAALNEFVKGKKLLPDSFTEGNRIENITGLYVPFWLYSCHANGTVNFEGQKTSRRWEDANYKYEKIDHYNLTRSGEMDFTRIPADASTQMDDATMDSLEPYDFSAAVEYDAAYFSGYLADRYDVESKDAQSRADERVTNTFIEKMKEKTSGFNSVSKKNENIQLKNAKAEYAMLPVWMMTTKYEGESYTFGINGQSGKMVGSLPIDKGKSRKYFIISSLISFVILQIIIALLGLTTPIVEVIGIVIALVIGYFYLSSLKDAMNTIKAGTSAASYLAEGSLNYDPPLDNLMYSTTNKTAKSNNNQ